MLNSEFWCGSYNWVDFYASPAIYVDCKRYVLPIVVAGTEWPILCWCAVKKLLTHYCRRPNKWLFGWYLVVCWLCASGLRLSGTNSKDSVFHSWLQNLAPRASTSADFVMFFTNVARWFCSNLSLDYCMHALNETFLGYFFVCLSNGIGLSIVGERKTARRRRSFVCRLYYAAVYK